MARKKKNVGAYPTGRILFSLTLALLLIGACGLLAIQSKRLVTNVREGNEVRAFLDTDLDSTDRLKLAKTIADQPFVVTANGQPQIRYVSKEDAAKEFIAETKEDFTQFLSDNPLHASYRIRLREDYFAEDKLKEVKSSIEKMDGVFEVVYPENMVDNINRNITKIYAVMAVFALVLLIIIVVLMNNTIRLALYSQRMLIRSMQLVGATNGFITRPFLTRGLTQGFMAGLISAIILFIGWYAAILSMPELTTLTEPLQLVMLAGGLIMLGMIIGLLSTLQAVHRYLDLSLDELY
ncbi:cell division protein FtsX [Fibrella forsythiae]|uniref:Cell division protein FtsX n=1 Tax=Fibrella forsythiae TaxID=2817061 RepID=A0ABS3JLS1_9BACT|nr:permease-like cell division protein FtsX [Fibrella forsythiae]MBO0950944.1 ABC transporter permease [Fibrella forsythiae]